MKALATLATVLTLLLTACGPGEDGDDAAPSGAPSASEGEPGSAGATPEDQPSQGPSETEEGRQGPPRPRLAGTVATGLEVPWGIDFLPDGTALVTERDSARVLAVPAGGGDPRQVGQIDAASPRGEAGLLGLAVSPDFDEDSSVFVYVTTDTDNRVLRMTYDGNALSRAGVVLDGIPNGFIHDGGRLEFGPDGHLYVSTGEIGEEELAQDRGSLAGKILRITPDGRPAPGNPDGGSPVWTLGHRNVQGLAFDDADRLWASEFGSDTWDELNRIQAGENYCWPQVEGRGDQEEFRNPARQWRTGEASPSGLAFAEGSLWMASLRGQRLWRVPVQQNGRTGEPQAFFVGEHGRLRTVVVAPDGSLWVATSNRDGRGDPDQDDDKILRVELR